MVKHSSSIDDSFTKEVFVYLNRWSGWKDKVILNQMRQTETDFFAARNDRGIRFWIPIIFLRLSNYLAGSYHKDVLDNKDNKNYEQKSKEFLSNEEVKKHLCLHFNQRPKEVVFSKEESVEFIIKTLKNMKLNAVEISEDSKLYAFISYEILQIGIHNFCDN